MDYEIACAEDADQTSKRSGGRRARPLSAQLGADAHENSSLTAAVEDNDAESVEEMLMMMSSSSEGADVDLLDVRDESGNTTLHTAARLGRCQICALLVRYGADVNAQNNALFTPLFFAARVDSETVSVLLDLGAQAQLCNHLGEIPLHAACSIGLLDVMMTLISRGGSDVNALSAHGLTPLYCAVGSGNSQAVNALIRLGADVNGVVCVNKGDSGTLSSAPPPLQLSRCVDSTENSVNLTQKQKVISENTDSGSIANCIKKNGQKGLGEEESQDVRVRLPKPARLRLSGIQQPGLHGQQHDPHEHERHQRGGGPQRQPQRGPGAASPDRHAAQGRPAQHSRGRGAHHVHHPLPRLYAHHRHRNHPPHYPQCHSSVRGRGYLHQVGEEEEEEKGEEEVGGDEEDGRDEPSSSSPSLAHKVCSFKFHVLEHSDIKEGHCFFGRSKTTLKAYRSHSLPGGYDNVAFSTSQNITENEREQFLVQGEMGLRLSFVSKRAECFHEDAFKTSVRTDTQDVLSQQCSDFSAGFKEKRETLEPNQKFESGHRRMRQSGGIVDRASEMGELSEMRSSPKKRNAENKDVPSHQGMQMAEGWRHHSHIAAAAVAVSEDECWRSGLHQKGGGSSGVEEDCRVDAKDRSDRPALTQAGKRGTLEGKPPGAMPKPAVMKKPSLLQKCRSAEKATQKPVAAEVPSAKEKTDSASGKAISAAEKPSTLLPPLKPSAAVQSHTAAENPMAAETPGTTEEPSAGASAERAPQGLTLTGLHRAAMLGLEDVARVLLVEGGAWVDCRTGAGETPLHLAALHSSSTAGIEGDNNRAGLVRLLLGAGADVHAVTSQGGSTPLHLGAMMGDSLTASLLLSAGADPNVRDGAGCTPLHRACQRAVCPEAHRVRTVRLLLSAGARAQAVDGEGLTPLHALLLQATDLMDHDVVRVLLTHGADPDLPTLSGEPPLLAALRHGMHGFATALLEKGARPDVAATDDGTTPLHYACREGQLQLFRLIWAKGGDPARPDSAGVTPLRCAVESGKEAVVRACIATGASSRQPPTPPDLPDSTPSTVHDVFADPAKLVSPFLFTFASAQPSTLAALYHAGCFTSAELHLLRTLCVSVSASTSAVHGLSGCQRDVVSFVLSVAGSPPSLQNLTRWKISHLLGCRADRKWRSRELGLPGLLREFVLFV